MLRMLVRIAAVAIISAAMIAAIWFVSFSVYLITPDRLLSYAPLPVRTALRQEFSPALGGLSAFRSMLFPNLFPPAEVRKEKVDSVNTDGSSVFGYLMVCAGGKVEPAKAGGEESDNPPEMTKMTWAREWSGSERTLNYLNTGIASHRISLDQKVIQSFATLLRVNVFAVFLGMLTTIVVAVSTSEFGRSGGRLALAMRIFAVVLPAAGTATASLVAFSNPQEEATRASTALAALDRLHAEIVRTIAVQKCVGKEPSEVNEGDFQKVTNDWLRRYQETQILAETKAVPGGSTSSFKNENTTQVVPSMFPMQTNK